MNLTRSITIEDFEHGGAPVPPELLGNAQEMATLLQAYLDATDSDVTITSGYRPPADNASVGGASTSQHLTASALDFVPKGITVTEWATQAIGAHDAGAAPDFGQLELDPSNGHVHLSLPGSHLNDVIVKQSDGTYAAWSPAAVDDAGGGSADFPMTAPTAATGSRSACRS